MFVKRLQINGFAVVQGGEDAASECFVADFLKVGLGFDFEMA